MAVAHGSMILPLAGVRAYNAELRDGNGGFLGDRASKRGFWSILDAWREKHPDNDVFGSRPSEELAKKELDKVLTGGDVEAAGVLLSAIEDFAQALAHVTERLLETNGWDGTAQIAVGGGMRASRIGELAIGRAGALVRERGKEVDLSPIHHHPDEAGLIGAAQLVPFEELEGSASMLAVDIGGTKIRAGVIELNADKGPDLCGARVMGFKMWRHRDDQPTRQEAIERLVEMLKALSEDAKRLTPVIGVGCPGLITPEGTIERGAQNLPAGWGDPGFNLPDCIVAAIPRIRNRDTKVVLHNDAVVQGLSEIPWMRGVPRWGILTIGTGLGNACFEWPCSGRDTGD